MRDFANGVIGALRSGNRESPLLLPSVGESLPVRSARAALVVALRSLDLAPSARVGVPLYCCSVVFKAIEAAGFTPRFLDVSPKTFCLCADDLRAKRGEFDAVIAVHMFGHVCDVPAMRKAAGNNKPVIEDCALSLGSKLGVEATGSFGDAAVFSFRSGKYLSVGEGGALFSPRAEIRARAALEVAAMPAPTRSDEAIHVAKTYLRSLLRSKPLYGIVGYALWEAYNARVQFSEKAKLVVGRIFETDRALVERRLAALDSMIVAQRRNAEFYKQNLSLDPAMLCFEEADTSYNHYQFPITFPSQEHRDSMASELYKRGVDSSKPLDEIAEVTAKYYGYKGDCPIAEKLAKQVLVIPNHFRLGRFELKRIAKAVNETWAVVSARLGQAASLQRPRTGVKINRAGISGMGDRVLRL